MDTLSSFSMILASAITLLYLAHIKFMMAKVPQSVPWAGLRKEVFSRIRANIRELTAGLRTLKIGYSQFNRKGFPWVIPDFGFRPTVMVPQEHISWMSEQPEDVLSARKAQSGRFALEYLLPGLDINHDAFMTGAIRKELTRNLSRMQPAMMEDIRCTIDQTMGLDTKSWNEVCIKQAMDKVFFTSINHVLVGSSLYRNEEYIRSSIRFANWLAITVVLVGQYMSWMIKPVGYFLALAVYYSKQKAMKLLVPVVQDRLSNIKRKRADSSFDFEEPVDLLTWITQAMLDDVNTKNHPPEFLAKRVLFLTLGAVHTTILTTTNVFLDLVSSNPDDKFWEQLREEAAGIFKSGPDWIDHASLPKLSLADSTIRETSRMNPMLTKVLLREVVAKDGATLPSGHQVPKGAWVAIDTVGVHHDDRFYPKPNEYRPFRFSGKNEDVYDVSSKANLTDKASIYRKSQDLSTTSDIFLSFGYRKHSCPGRWLVAHQMKLMLAYVVLNYDIQHTAQRPANFVFGDTLVPSPSATMKVRRRKHI